MILKQDAIRDFDSFYNKEYLIKGIVPFVKHFYKTEQEFCLNNGLKSALLTSLEIKKTPSKADLLTFCMPVFFKKELFLKFIESLPADIQKVYNVLLWQNVTSENEIEKLIGKKPYAEAGDKWSYRKMLNKEFHFFGVKALHTYSSNKNDIFFEISIPQNIRKLLKTYYPAPENSKIQPVDDIEVTKKSKVIESESLVLRDLSKVIAYYLQDNIKFSTRGKPNASTLNKMKKTLQLQEYYEESKELGNLRAYLLAMAVSGCTKKDIKPDLIEQTKHLFARYMSGGYPLAEFLLTQIKGFHQVYDQYLLQPEKEIISLLKEMPVGQWLALNNLEMYAKYHEFNFLPTQYDWVLNNQLYFDTMDDSSYGYVYKSKSYIKKSRAELFLGRPFLNGFLFLLSSLGMLDIAYEEPNTSEFAKTYFSDYDGLNYIRINQLGAYILGLSKEYTTEIVTGGKLIFADDSLIILAEGDISLYDVLLKNYAEKVSETRFRVTPQSFLKDCKSRKDLKSKIDTFRQTVSQKLPPNWEEFIGTLIEKNKNITPVNDFKVFKINANEKELQQIVAQDKVLKDLVIKAEKFHVLVSSDNYAKFKSRLKDFGYLVD